MRNAKIAKDIDDYLAGVPAEQRAALEKLRKIIRAAAPKATEHIGYRIPIFKYHGMLVGFAAFKGHCSFFPGTSALAAYRRELAGFSTAKGTIHFTPDQPLPAALVRKIVRARIQQNEARWKERPTKKRQKT